MIKIADIIYAHELLIERTGGMSGLSLADGSYDEKDVLKFIMEHES